MVQELFAILNSFASKYLFWVDRPTITKTDIAEIIIGKQRNGPIGTVELAWLPRYTRFANLER